MSGIFKLLLNLCNFLSINIKSVFLWIMVKENRDIGIKYTRKAIEMATVMSKLTKTTKDDKAAAYLSRQFDKAVKINNINSKKDIKSVANDINNISTGCLSDLNIGISNGKIKTTVLGGKATYDPSDGSVSIGFSR